MKDKELGALVGAGVCGLFAGLLVASGGFKGNLVRMFALSGLISTPVVFVAHLLIDTKATNRVNKAQEEAQAAKTAASKAGERLSELEESSLRLTSELLKIKEVLRVCDGDRQKFSGMVASLTPMITGLEQELATANSRIEELEADTEAWEEEFHSRVAFEADKRFQVAKKEEIQRIFDEHDFITSEAMRLFRQLQGWGHKVAASHQQKRELITSLAQSYNQNIDELNASVDKERDRYLEQIDQLNIRVAQLQHELAGDLVEPEYGQFGFDQNGRIANALAEWLWNHHKIPLKVTGFEVGSDGTLTAGFTYSRSMAPESLARVIEGESSQITRTLGLYAIEKPQKLQIADVFTVRVRRDRPARKTDKGSLYRSRDEFVKYILSLPVRLRVIGEPGAGKTPTVAVLLSHILKRGFLNANTPNGQKLPYCVAESCNPLAGISVKNGDELDFCQRWNDGKKGFKGLVEEYRFRKNPANAEYKNQVGYIWIADEVDNTMAELTKDEAKPFKDALKDGGHVNLGVIVMGQSANVSTSKGLSIDDQKMMTNIYIDPVSIRTFLTQYGERFYSKKAVEKALATLEELELEIEEQNEIICDTAREFRIAMVTANRSPVFYQLPYFDSVEIDLECYQKSLTEVAHIRATGQQCGATTDKVKPLSVNDVAGQSAGAVAAPTQVSCPKCASTVKRNGKTSSGTQKYLCKNPECKHGFSE
jgi:hypothetical protein